MHAELCIAIRPRLVGTNVTEPNVMIHLSSDSILKLDVGFSMQKYDEIKV